MAGLRDKKLILIVEDEMDMRFFLNTLFETNDFRVAAARNGQEGIERAACLRPDLILLDVMMPKEGGMLMYRQLKNDPDLRHIPVVMLSAISPKTFQHSLAMLNLHSNDALPLPEAYIEKPPDPESVLRTVRQFI